jgi:hypothetical protein
MSLAASRRPDAPETARAKPLRGGPGELSPEAATALLTYTTAATTHARNADTTTDNARRRAAFSLIVALRREARRPLAALPDTLMQAIERWEDGEFGGTDVDLDVAEQAAWELGESPG